MGHGRTLNWNLYYIICNMYIYKYDKERIMDDILIPIRPTRSPRISLSQCPGRQIGRHCCHPGQGDLGCCKVGVWTFLLKVWEVMQLLGSRFLVNTWNKCLDPCCQLRRDSKSWINHKSHDQSLSLRKKLAAVTASIAGISKQENLTSIWTPVTVVTKSTTVCLNKASCGKLPVFSGGQGGLKKKRLFMDASFKVEQDLGTLHQDLQSDKLGKMNNNIFEFHTYAIPINS